MPATPAHSFFRVRHSRRIVRRAANLAAAATCLRSSAALCQEAPGAHEMAHETWEAHPVTMLGHLGFSTPLGLVGVSVEYMPTPWFVVAAGLGTNTRRLDFAAEAGPRLPIGEYLALGARVGLAYGAPYSRCPEAGLRCDLPDAVPSLHWNGYLEARVAKGFLSRVYGGALDPLRGSRAALLTPFVGIAFGSVL
jgi:hypothetical protein